MSTPISKALAISQQKGAYRHVCKQEQMPVLLLCSELSSLPFPFLFKLLNFS